MSVTFAKGGTVVELRNPVVKNRGEVIKHQAMGLSADGSRRVYDKGVAKRRLALLFTELYESEKTELEGFFDSSVNGIEKTFTYTDHDGTIWSARFLSSGIDFTEQADAAASKETYDVDGTTCPTTTRQNGKWQVELELEAEPV